MKSKDLRKYKEEFIKLYKEGYSLRKIGELYGVSKTSVKRYVEEGCEIRQKGLTDEQKEKSKELYLEGLTVSAISKEIGCPDATLRRYLSTEFGVVSSNGYKKYEHIKNDIISDYESGLSATEVAKKYKVARQTVMNYVAESKVEARTYSETSRVYDMNEDYFAQIDKHKSWILGLVFAKGRLDSHPGNKFLDISVYESRAEILDAITKELYKNGSPNLGMVDNTLRLRVSSSKLYDTLNSFGIYNKSDYKKMSLPKEVDIISFWKGYIYANISVDKRKIYIPGDKYHIDALADYLSTLSIGFRRPYDTGVVIESKKDVQKLIDIYPFVKDFILGFVSNYDKDKYHSWSSIIN